MAKYFAKSWALLLAAAETKLNPHHKKQKTSHLSTEPGVPGSPGVLHNGP